MRVKFNSVLCACAGRAMAVARVSMGLVMSVATLHAMAQAPVSDPTRLEARITQLERSMSGSSLLQMHQTLQTLAREVRELRGQVEEQAHSMEQLKRRQRDMFLDLDKRIQATETNAAAPASGALPAAVTPPPVESAAVGGAVIPPQAPPSVADSTGNVVQTDPAEEQKAYRAAFDLLKSGKFTEAAAALTSFLGQHPNGNFADNAQYWLGEAYYVSREFGPALKAFEQLLVDYPESPKRPHSMLKIGFIYDETGQKDEARKVLTELTKQYPQSTAASLAAKRLKRL